MRHRNLLAISATFSALTVSLVALGGGGPAAQDQAQQKKDELRARVSQEVGGRVPEEFYFGATYCAGCHEVRNKGTTSQICRFIEYAEWKGKDKHQNAFEVLKGERAQGMGKLLGFDVTKPENGCVACHGVVVKDEQLTQNFEPEKRAAEGVTCVACHGAYRDWAVEHAAPGGRIWTNLDREQKEKHFGMVDLWDPAIRARKCDSCHIGNIDDGKFLTHAMYAAGHPPLPGIELSQFSDQEPKHWQYLAEKPKDVQQRLQYDGKELEKSKLVVVNGVVALRESIRLLADQAKAKGASASLDLTHFDCYACHHDLNVPGWRQPRGYDGSPPGRPKPRPWPHALTRLALRHVGQDDAALDAKLKPLRDAFDARPFGDPDAVARKAADVVAWLDGLGTDVGKAACDRPAAAKMLPMLCDIAAATTPDYDSARQVAWAFRTIYGELHGDDRHPADPKVLDVIKALNAELKLDLPKGIEPEVIVTHLDETLDRVADYDPARFKAHMAELKTLIDREKAN